MQRRSAFSLVELSIVLVILGLLVGGVLSGQSLIRASELRAVTEEFSRYKAAIGTFRDKYFAIPGDMTNATAFWTTAAACPGISTTAAGGTCNGDGNGQITNVATNANEPFRFWQHLALAGMIEGNYSGTSGDTTATDTISTINTNVPRSKMSNAGWSIFYLGDRPVSDVNYFDASYANAFLFGTGTSLTQSAVLKPQEAWNIDTKLDDGKPATGAVMSDENEGAAASTTSCSDTAPSGAASLTASNYSLANTGQYCSLIFKSGY